MKIIIDSDRVDTRTGESSKGPWEIRTQMAYADTGKRYPTEIRIRLPAGKAPYAPGEYAVNMAESIYVSRYGALSLSEQLVLVPLKTKAVA